MSEAVDARGLLCPEPVLRTKKVIDKMKSGTLEILVDNRAAKENVTRLCESKGWKVEVEGEGPEFTLRASK
ncbi:MAG: sulfurtransferase TusA family protein [Clostridiales bacterium]|nr:sulfurtransferase TusA family protein [Clostridiales bacterium]MCF8022001.1 sulfurtransferase TusA family protein [Clostridiales bacterium]